MGSKILSTQHLLQIPLPSFPTPSQRPKLAYALQSPSRLSISVPTSHFAILQPVSHRSINVKVVSGQPDGVEGVEAAEEEAEGNKGEGETLEEEAAVEEKAPRKPIVKLGDVMGILNRRAIEAAESERPVPDIRTGDIVEIKLEVPENRRRASIYKGIVISKQNAGIHTTIRIRRIIAGIGVEIVFPVYSPNIKEIKVVKHRKVRRARLYYLRDKLPRLSTFK